MFGQSTNRNLQVADCGIPSEVLLAVPVGSVIENSLYLFEIKWKNSSEVSKEK